MGLLDTVGQKAIKAVGLTLDADPTSPPSPDFPDGLRIYEIVDGKEYPLPNDSNYGVILAGSFMPHNSLDFGGTQQIVKEYYPGASEPSVQVLGPREDDITIKGRLKLKRFKVDDADGIRGLAESYQRQLDAIRLRGNLLRIELGEWKRWGFLERSKFMMKTLKDIDYELSFIIVGFNRPQNCKFTENNSDTVASSNKDLNNAAAQLLLKQTNFPDTMPRSISDFLNDQIGAVADVVATVTGFVDGVIGDVQSVANSANRAVGMIKYARAYISRTVRSISQISYSISNLGSAFSTEAEKASAQVRNISFINGTKSDMTSIQAYLAQLQLRYQSIAQTTPQARHLVQAGDTLQKISIKFFNTPDRWKNIYDHNKLTSTNLVSGTVLEIPR